MLFNSFEFIILVICTFIVFYIPKFARLQIIILILSSLFFYAYNNPYLLILLVLSTIVNTTASYQVNHHPDIVQKRLWALSGLIINILVLAFFKYNKLIIGAIYHDLSKIDGAGAFLLTLPLPIGISFFTFEGISLVVDTFRMKQNKNLPVFNVDKDYKKHWIRTTFFVIFFPHLVAGPILKAHEFFPQMVRKYFKDIDWEFCIKTLILGYFLKMVVADSLKDQTFWIMYPHFKNHSTFTLITLLFGYSMQIFADFAGYSLIAIGIAALFGYRFPDNFNFPYISRSFAEFWKRWHISLSSWLRNYLYIPLGGNKKGNIRTYFNLFTVMFLGGLWHGAAWSYAVWGVWHGAALAIERLFKSITDKYFPKNIIFITFQVLFVFIFVTISWLLFKLPDFSQVIEYIKALSTNTKLKTNWSIIISVMVYSIPVIIYHFQYLIKQNNDKCLKWLKSFKPFAYAFMLFAILFNYGEPGDFIYFQF